MLKLSSMGIMFISLLLCSLSVSALAHDPSGKATYLGNEALLVSDGQTSALFDAFFDDDYGTYTLVPEQILSDLAAGQAPYDTIQTLFITHVHGDHFSVERVVDYLRAHPSVEIYGPAQMTTEFETAGLSRSDPLQERVHTFDPAVGKTTKPIKIGPWIADALSVPHSGDFADVQNLIWRVAFENGPTISHFGDADPQASNFDGHVDFFKTRPIDLAFVPYWFYRAADGERILETIVGARSSIGFHLPDATRENPQKWREEVSSNLFFEPGETIDIPHRLEDRH